MGNPRGVKRDFGALETRRFEPVKLFGKSLNNSEIGRRLKVSNQTVSRWRKEYQDGGSVALRSAWRILRQLRWSVQQPVGRALERNEARIEDWKQRRWPEIKKKPKKRGGRSFSSTKAV